MLTGKLVRVRIARNKVQPLYVNASDRQWLSLAEQLCFAFEDATGKTRGELEEYLTEIVGDGPGQLVPQGLAKLLEDRCEYEVFADSPPDAVRECVFRLSTEAHNEAGRTKEPFDRTTVLAAAADELKLAPEMVERSLFADLHNEQRIEKFEPLAPQALLHKYNVSIAQAILLRAVRMEVLVLNESAARFRQLFRAVKFHRLICKIKPGAGASYRLILEGPLSLFSGTQKYGLQLALFLPTLLHCKTFELTAEVRWGAEKKEKQFTLSSSEGLRSHLPDFGVYTPPEVTNFAANFREDVTDWTLIDDPAPQLLDGMIWVPDFTLRHSTTGQDIFLEVLGFWRKVDLESHYQRLKNAIPNQFLLVVSEQYRADDADEFATGDGVYRYKRTPIASAVGKLATQILATRSTSIK